MQFLLLSTFAATALMAALAAVPLIIHLINMMRHRRVEWAAMEFLLQSYKKQRNWIFLKQLLLLLLRMAAMVAIVAMLARLDTADQLAAMFGGTTTHHYVLLDDSYSMSDEGSGRAAFEAAKDVVSTIARRAAQEKTRQRITLVRFSRATLAPPQASSSVVVDARLDLNAEIVHAAFDEMLEEKRRIINVTQLSTGPQAALDIVKQLVAEAKGELAHVYLLSDFRRSEWRNPAEVRKSFQQLESAGADLHMVRCVSRQQPNLAITHLAPSDQTRAAGVPLYVVVKVKNFGPDPARKIPVKIKSVYFDPGLETQANAGKLDGQEVDLPTVLIDKVDAGETATRRVQVFFPTAGKHVVEASLPDDAVKADNVRTCAIDFPEGVPVLLVDDDSTVQNDAYYIASVFQPGQRARTGVRPEIKTSAFLRDTGASVLQTYQSIYLFNVVRLDENAVTNLRRYVEGGGGLAIFLGPKSSTDYSFYNDLAAGPDGLFPVPLEGDAPLLRPAVGTDSTDDETVSVDPAVPDFRAEDHPVFTYLSGESNVYLRGVAVDRYFRTPASFEPPPQSSTQIIARLRNRFPLAVAKQYGNGRVVAFLTTAAPLWNSWARDDSFGLMVLNLQSYLAAPGRSDLQLPVGGPLDLQLDVTRFFPEVGFYVPSISEGRRQKIVRNAVRPKEDSPVMNAAIGRADDGTSRNGQTDRRGVYEAWPVTRKNQVQVERFALNVDPREGDLAVVEPTGLAAAMLPVTFELHQAEEYQYETSRRSSSNWTNALLILLICLLLAEQALAYSASYHPARGGAA